MPLINQKMMRTPKKLLLLCTVLMAPICLFAQVEPPTGPMVNEDVKGDFFRSKKQGSNIFDADPGALKSNTEPPPPAAIQAEPSPTPTPEAQPQQELPNQQSSSGKGENLKEQVIERAKEDGGIMELLDRTRQIKEQLGVGEQNKGKGAAPTKEHLQSIIEGVKQTVEDDPKKKNNQIAFNLNQQTTTNRDKYAPKSVLSLIVSGSDAKHLKRHTAKLDWMVKHRNVKVGNVFIVGMSGVGGTLARARGRKKPSTRTLAPGKAWLEHNYQQLSNIGLDNYEVVLNEKLFDRLDLHYSPTWVVRHLGRDYVFEGYTDPVHFFTKKGEFVRADY